MKILVQVVQNPGPNGLWFAVCVLAVFRLSDGVVKYGKAFCLVVVG